MDLHDYLAFKRNLDTVFCSISETLFYCYLCILDTIQDFLCKLGMKTHMYLVEISISSLNHVTVRPSKIIKDLSKAST